LAAKRKTTAVKRAVRRKSTTRTSNRSGRAGRNFFFSMLLILAFALIYYFFGQDIQSHIGARLGGAGAIALEENEILVSFLDVGQGDSILVRSRDHAILIDGGEHAQRNAVISYLRSAGVRRLDYVVATHPHSDHIGGLVTVLRQLDVGQVIMPDVTHNTATFERFLEVIENNNIPVIFPAPGDRIQAGIIDFAVLGPPNPHPGPQSNLNNASIILRLEHGQNSFMFTGDAERELENWLVNSGTDLSSSVLKVGHHGSRTSTTEAFLDAVNPRAAVISLGANNTHGHPHREVMDRLNARNILIYRTDQLGTIRMITDGQRIDLLR